MVHAMVSKFHTHIPRDFVFNTEFCRFSESCPFEVSGVGSSPALATCETIQVLLAGVPGVFSRGPPVFAHLLIGPSHMS